MTTQIIGRVMMAFKGNYDTTKQYNFLDTVEYNGSSFVCKANGTHDIPSEHSANWQLLAKAGETPDTSIFALKSELPNLTPYAKKTDLPDLSGYATTDKVQSLIDQKSNTINESIVKLDNKVNGIQIGGRNLLKGTSDQEVAGKPYSFKDYYLIGNLQPGETYTLSAFARVDQTAINQQQRVFVDIYTEDWKWSFEVNISSSLNYQYGSVTFTAPTDVKNITRCTVYLSHPDGVSDSSKDSLSGNGYIKCVKLEKGNKATGWSPAPEDLLSKSEAEETYAKKSDIPTSMAWQNITDKPDVATKSDIPTSIDWNSVTNKPDLATSAGLPKDLVHTTDLDKTNQKVSDVELTANQALSVATNGQSIATDAQNEAQSVSARVETLTNQLNSANQVRTITSGTLADLANKNGQYHYEIDCIPSDLPSGVSAWGMCDVTVGPHYAKEIFTVTGANDNNGRVFVRVRGYGSSAWNDWREVTLWS